MAKNAKRRANLPADVMMMQASFRQLRTEANDMLNLMAAAEEEVLHENIMLRGQRELIAKVGAEHALAVSKALTDLGPIMDAIPQVKEALVPVLAAQTVMTRTLERMSRQAAEFYAGRGAGNQPPPDEFVPAGDVAAAIEAELLTSDLTVEETPSTQTELEPQV